MDTLYYMQGWEKPVFFNPAYLFFKKPRFFGVFKEKQYFVLFLRKTEKPHSELFLFHHAISLFSELHNNNLLYPLWHSKLRVKNVPHLCFHEVLLVSSLLNSKTWQACSQQTEKNHFDTNSAVSFVVWHFSCIINVFDYNNSSQAIANYLVMTLEHRILNYFRCISLGANYWDLYLSFTHNQTQKTVKNFICNFLDFLQQWFSNGSHLAP